jgi:hypothetical protein
MKITIDMNPGDRAPKRGDLLQTNIGNRRERTCLILRSRRSRRQVDRFHLWCERWWELEPDLRLRLYRSAERAGGQNLIGFVRYRPAKKRRGVPFD